MKVKKQEAGKFLEIKKTYVSMFLKRTDSYINSISLLYTTISSALLLFSFNTNLIGNSEKIFLKTSIFLSILIVISTLIFKFFFSRLPLELINSQKAEEFFKKDIIELSPKKLTEFALKYIPPTTILLIFLQLVSTLIVALIRIG